jgi:2-polyprenyl-3-methyl-5-hydroxy-6-metoxy-1,4-benzoquinol methylase
MDRNRRVSTHHYSLAHCGECGLLFVSDPPLDIAAYYTSDYHFVPKNIAELEEHLSSQQFKVDILRRFICSGEILEVGPSIGQFCALAQKQGFAVSAIEMD